MMKTLKLPDDVHRKLKIASAESGKAAGRLAAEIISAGLDRMREGDSLQIDEERSESNEGGSEQ